MLQCSGRGVPASEHTDRFLPAKAIDLIDEAAARIKMEIDSKPEVMDKLDRRLIQIKIEVEAVKKEKDEASPRRRVLIKEEIDKLRAAMADFQCKGQLDKVAELQYGKLPQLEAQLKAAEATSQKVGAGGTANRLLRTQVGTEEIAEVVSRATGIPVSKMMQGEREKLLTMEEKLHGRVVGS